MVTGHSLGAGAAALLTLQLKDRYPGAGSMCSSTAQSHCAITAAHIACQDFCSGLPCAFRGLSILEWCLSCSLHAVHVYAACCMLMLSTAWPIAPKSCSPDMLPALPHRSQVLGLQPARRPGVTYPAENHGAVDRVCHLRQGCGASRICEQPVSAHGPDGHFPRPLQVSRMPVLQAWTLHWYSQQALCSAIPHTWKASSCPN